MSNAAAEKPIRRVAIIGAGPGPSDGSAHSGFFSGPELALLCMRAGFDTVLEDVLPSNLRRAAAAIESVDPALTPRYAGSIEDAVRDADLAIDTVPDELESKLEILSLLDRMAPPHTLFATPTEALSIADLASCTYRPAQCFGLRFGALSSLLMEVSYPSAAAGQTLALVVKFFSSLGAAVQTRQDTHPNT